MKYGKGPFWGAHELVRTYSEGQTGCPVTYYYSFRDIRRLIKDYRMIEMCRDHIFPYNIDKYFNYEYERIWYFRWLPKALSSWLETHFCWHTLVVAQPLSSGTL
jgi:hypothetical protein